MAGGEGGGTERLNEPEWRARNRANWDERVAVHLGPGLNYDLASLRSGTAALDEITTAVLGPVAGLKVAHLQCHFGADTLVLAREGCDAVGLDFSGPAIDAARALAAELGITARFVQADVYDAPTVLAADPGGFDRVLVSWGALCWLPDMAAWSQVVSQLLKPGGWLALAEAHPAAYVFDDAAGVADQGTAETPPMPGWFAPYLDRARLILDDELDYADPAARLTNTRTHQWLHPLSDVIGGLLSAGLRLDSFSEHDTIPWRMFRTLVERPSGCWTWPDRKWLPLSFALRASKPLSTT